MLRARMLIGSSNLNKENAKEKRGRILNEAVAVWQEVPECYVSKAFTKTGKSYCMYGSEHLLLSNEMREIIKGNQIKSYNVNELDEIMN